MVFFRLVALAFALTFALAFGAFVFRFVCLRAMKKVYHRSLASTTICPAGRASLGLLADALSPLWLLAEACVRACVQIACTQTSMRTPATLIASHTKYLFRESIGPFISRALRVIPHLKGATDNDPRTEILVAQMLRVNRREKLQSTFVGSEWPALLAFRVPFCAVASNLDANCALGYHGRAHRYARLFSKRPKTAPYG